MGINTGQIIRSNYDCKTPLCNHAGRYKSLSYNFLSHPATLENIELYVRRISNYNAKDKLS